MIVSAWVDAYVRKGKQHTTTTKTKQSRWREVQHEGYVLLLLLFRGARHDEYLARGWYTSYLLVALPNTRNARWVPVLACSYLSALTLSLPPTPICLCAE